MFLVSCEGITEGDGYVFDARTKKPLDSVLVKSYRKNGWRKIFQSEMITDSTGYFFGTTGLTGCSGDCPDLVIEFVITGYSNREIINPNKDTVYLQ
jgi:hypothetical protein